ncbi:MAG: DCC1-like thiol-disulfide oxidoreductase family protein [Chitinophagales bacterium]|nr:DCC1-like thiol-disulfide oxidoreductase family protein [Chitinophagales bacterium]MDW8418372.1 DCC1-like thiol-disulfide oxidoreductase family protein [Chitinophagales bacterium]
MYVVLFDGVCNLCNYTVQWIIRRDKRDKFRFASLQSSMAQQIAAKWHLHGELLQSVVLVEGDRIHIRSSAILRILMILGGVYRIAGVLYLIPAFIRDRVYDYVAKNRYKWFGKKDSCIIPSDDVIHKFIG